MHAVFSRMTDRIRKVRTETLCAAILVAMTILFMLTGVANRLDYILYDLGQVMAPGTVPDDLVVVAIDEDSLNALGRWPWHRRHHAQVVRQLHADGARAIGLDLLFSEPQTDDPQADEDFRQAMLSAGNVVLPVVVENTRSHGPLIESLPIPALASAAAAIGMVHAEVDEDNVARSIYLWAGMGEPPWPHFAQALLQTAGALPASMAPRPPSQAQGEGWYLTKTDRRYIHFSSYRNDFQTISYAQVLRGEFAPGTFHNKIVLIGATAAGLSDKYPTPVSGLRAPMPGVIFLANALTSMRQETLMHRTGGVGLALLCGLLVCVPLLWLPSANPLGSLTYNVILVMGFVVLYLAFLLLLHLWVPMAAALLGLLGSYPVWAWLRLSAASRALDQEILRLRGQLAQWGGQLQNGQRVDPLEDRLRQIRAAIEQLARMKDERLQTLEFISHDIRVPLASALVQVKQHLGAKSHAHGLLSQALDWTEDFLHFSRVQTRGTGHFSEQDVSAIVEEAVDDVYPLVVEAGLALELQTPDEPVWVWGDFELLKRSFHNLLSNSVKYAQDKGTVQILVKRLAEGVEVSVSNHAGQHPAPELERLFERYAQSWPHASPWAGPKTNGVGLGLHFVRSVMDQHQGAVALRQEDGLFVVTVRLPFTRETHQH